MWVFVAVLAMLAAILWRKVTDSGPEARYQKIGRELVTALEEMFFGNIRPSLRASIEFRSGCGRWQWLWGPWFVSIRVAYDPDIDIDVLDLSRRKILREVRELYAGERFEVDLMFMRKEGQEDGKRRNPAGAAA